MTKLPAYPYLQNMVKFYRQHHGDPFQNHSRYSDWLILHGIRVPTFDDIVFDNISEQELVLFKLKYS